MAGRAVALHQQGRSIICATRYFRPSSFWQSKMEAALLFDSGDHTIYGVSQAQQSNSTLVFTSQHGVVKISDLRKVWEPK